MLLLLLLPRVCYNAGMRWSCGLACVAVWCGRGMNQRGGSCRSQRTSKRGRLKPMVQATMDPHAPTVHYAT